jgi:hypothetical protein
MDAELDRLEEEERLLAEKRAQKEGKTEQPTDTAATSTHGIRRALQKGLTHPARSAHGVRGLAPAIRL